MSIQEKKEIVIAVSTDENYLVPTYVTLHSMMKCADKNNIYMVYILTKNHLADKAKILNGLMEEFANLCLSYVNVGEKFDNCTMIIKHTTIASMYRLILPEILKEYKKCIYIDTDVLICSDIAELMEVNLGNNYIGAVRDTEAKQYINEFDYGELVVPEEYYVNSGVMVMELEMLRRDNIVNEFIELSQKKMLFMDQDIVNISLQGKIKFLPLKFNALSKYRFTNYKFESYVDEINKVFTTKEIHEAIDKPVVIHYAQPLKPWQCKYVYKGEKWFGYIKNNIDKDIISDYIRPFVEKNKKSISVQKTYIVKYILSKIGIYKHVLRFTGKI